MPTAAAIRRYAADPAVFLNDLIIPAVRGQARFGDVMADYQRERFATIIPALLAIAHGDKPPIGKHWWEATKGASKDSDLACCLLWLLSFTCRPLSCQIGAADADQADELRKAAKAILRLNPWLDGRIEIQNLKLLCKTTSSDAEIIPADTAGSHGARPDVLILNELSHITKQEFAENLADNASKVPHGLVVIATNAGFTGSWQFRWRNIAQSSRRWSFNQFAKPAPWLDADEIEEAQRRNSLTRFNRLWYGVWSSGSGDAIDPQDIDASVDQSLRPMAGTTQTGLFSTVRDIVFGPRPEPSPAAVALPTNMSFVAGLDLGIKHDHSAMVVLGSNHATQRIRLAFARSWAPDRATGKVDLEAVEQSVLWAWQVFRPTGIHFDPFQAELMAQRLTRRGVPMREMPFVGGNLNTMATTLMEVFRSRRIDLYSHDRLVADLRRLSIVEKSYGHKLEATRDADGHADTATALAICLPAAVGLASSANGPGTVTTLAVSPIADWPPVRRIGAQPAFGSSYP